jgi:type II secretory pathway component PulF
MSKRKPSFPLKEQIVLFKQLSFLIRAGLPLRDSITSVLPYVGKKRKDVIRSIAKDISEGKELSESLAEHTAGLSPFFINLIKIGEETGMLEKSLRTASEEASKRSAFIKKIVSAMTYPACIAAVALCLIGFLTMSIFPKIRPLFASMSVKLPLSTRMLIAISDFTGKHWLLLVGIATIATICIIYVSRKRVVKTSIEWIQWRIPILGILLQNYFLMNISGALGIMLGAGTPLHEALRLQSPPHIGYKTALRSIQRRNQRGERLSSALSLYPQLFPALMIQLISAAELSGSLSETLLYLAHYFEEQLDEGLKVISGMLEPLLLLGMGVCVGFIALSMILPIYGLSQAISSVQ